MDATDMLKSPDYRPLVSYRRCLKCGHAWVDYEERRQVCVLCHGEKLSQPISLSRIRKAIALAEKGVTDGMFTSAELTDRRALLLSRYTQAAPVFAARADETFSRISARYLNGDLSDRCLDALVFCFHLFAELGLHDAAVRCSLMIGSGYFRRAQNKEIHTLNDLADLAAARQWFRDLDQYDWVATVDLLIGLKAGHTVLDHIHDKYLLLQLSCIHLHRAREYYIDKHLPEIQSRIDKETDWINDQLSHAITAVAHIDAAHINAQSRIEAANITSAALHEVAESLSAVAGSIAAGFEELSLSVEAGLDGLGQRIDLAGGRISTALAVGAKYIGDQTLSAGYAMGSSIQQHGKDTREGLSELGTEVRKSVDAAGDKAARAMSGLGTKVALGVVGGGALHALIMDGTLKELAGTITPQVRQGMENLHLIQSAQSATHPATLRDVQDVLISQGLDEVNARTRSLGLQVVRAGSHGG